MLDASVIITAPDRDPLAPADAPPPSATASVLLTVPAAGLSIGEAQLRQLVAGAAENLAADNVAIVVARAPAPPEGLGAPALDSVGPILVPVASRTPLQVAFAIALALIATLAGWLFLNERNRVRRKNVDRPTA